VLAPAAGLAPLSARLTRMASNHVETLRPIYAEWARGNFASGQPPCAPDLVYTGFVPDGRVTTQGREEFLRWIRELFSHWDDYRVEADEFVQLDDDTVLVAGRQYGTGRQSGVKVEAPVFSVWIFRGEQVAGLHFDPDRERVLEAAGLL